MVGWGTLRLVKLSSAVQRSPSPSAVLSFFRLIETGEDDDDDDDAVSWRDVSSCLSATGTSSGPRLSVDGSIVGCIMKICTLTLTRGMTQRTYEHRARKHGSRTRRRCLLVYVEIVEILTYTHLKLVFNCPP